MAWRDAIFRAPPPASCRVRGRRREMHSTPSISLIASRCLRPKAPAPASATLRVLGMFATPCGDSALPSWPERRRPGASLGAVKRSPSRSPMTGASGAARQSLLSDDGCRARPRSPVSDARPPCSTPAHGRSGARPSAWRRRATSAIAPRAISHITSSMPSEPASRTYSMLGIFARPRGIVDQPVEECVVPLLVDEAGARPLQADGSCRRCPRSAR